MQMVMKAKETNEPKGENIWQGRGLQFQIEWSEKDSLKN